MTKQYLVAWIKQNWMWLAALITLLVLLAKNPYSERNLISNFEPFPDTFHYVVPPRCWLTGQGWKLCRPHQEGLKPEVPPLYSIGLIPFYLVNFDPRTFYFANILLSLTALSFFYLIIKRLTKFPLLQALILFVYVTNYFIYWYPNLAMAENLILPVFLAACWLFLRNLQRFKLTELVELGLLSSSFYFIKPAYAIFSPLILGWLLILLIKHRHQFSPLFQKLGVSAVIALTSYLLLRNLSSIRWVLRGFSQLSLTPLAQDNNWFSFNHWLHNFPQYLQALVGKPIPFLWDRTPLVTPWMGWLGLGGYVLTLLRKKLRLKGLFFLSLLLAQIIFIASFYAIDGRYIYHAIPLMLIGMVMALDWLGLKLKTVHRSIVFGGLLILMGLVYVYPKLSLLKTQVMLNLKYAEQPWWYLAVKQLDEAIINQPAPINGTRPVLIVAHPPFLFDFYSHHTFDLLPLTVNQDFRKDSRAKLWGPYDYSNYLKLYESFLKAGRTLYVTNYGLGNEKSYHQDYQAILDHFQTELISSGCYEQCNLFQLSLPLKSP